jgi:hypothetical protein
MHSGIIDSHKMTDGWDFAKSMTRLVSFMIGISMTILLYILEFSDSWSEPIPIRSMYFTVLPLIIFLLTYYMPGDDTIFDA